MSEPASHSRYLPITQSLLALVCGAVAARPPTAPDHLLLVVLVIDPCAEVDVTLRAVLIGVADLQHRRQAACPGGGGEGVRWGGRRGAAAGRLEEGEGGAARTGQTGGCQLR